MARQPLRLLLRNLWGRSGPPGSGGLPDAQLVERFVRSRDEAAFEVLVWRHGGMFLDLCRRILRHEQDVEDAFQATYLTLARKAGSISKKASVASWLYKVAYRVALAARSQRQRQAQGQQPCFDLAAKDADDDLAWRELRPVLDDELNRLPEKFRAAFVLCCLERKTNEEAAVQLGCPKGTVQSRLSRARNQLRQRLSRRGFGLAAGLAAAFGAEQGLAASVPASLVPTTLHAAQAVAAGQGVPAVVSSRAAVLMEGALHAMFMSKLKTTLLVALVFALAGGISLLGVNWLGGAAGPAQAKAQWDKQSAKAKPAKSPDPAEALKSIQRRILSQNNLKNMGVAFYSYADAVGHLPAPAIYSKEGKPLLSWRVALLPYLEQGKLYKRFKLDEPWDSVHNKALLKEIPTFYASVGPREKKPGMTYYQVFVGNGAPFEAGQEMRIPASFPDGTSNTIFVVEAAAPVPWTKPADLPYDDHKPLPKLGGLFQGNFNALRLDGSVQFLSKHADAVNLRDAITRAAGDQVDWDKLKAREVDRAREKLDAKKLPRANARLKEILDKTLAEVQQAQQELEILKLKARGVANVDTKTLKLIQENERLQKAVEKALDELARLREETARLDTELNHGLVEGKITLAGKPVARGRVAFHTSTGKFIVAQIKDGAYQVRNIPNGRMRVTIEFDGAPEKYTKPETSPLQVEVTEGKNSLDFNLQQ